MKTLTAGALSELITKLGIEPLTILAIDWYNTDSFFLYADKEISGITNNASILNVSTLNASPSDRIGQALDITIVLDDTNGQIKSIIDAVNVQQRSCILYQYFAGLAGSDKFILFKGVVDTPIEWSEPERTITLQIITEVENTEIGVSLEETDIIVTEDSAPWPLAYGNVVHVPATKVNQYPIAKLAEPFCTIDQMLYAQLRALLKAWYDQQWVMVFWKMINQGADGFTLYKPSELLVLYIYWIKLEDYYQRLVDQNKLDIMIGRRLRHRRRKKTAAEQILIGRIGDLRDEIAEYKVYLKNIQYQKALVEREIDLAQYEKDLKRASARNIVGALSGLANIYYTYVEAMMEICRQSECAITTMRVEESENFEQNTVLILTINNLKWRGYFHDDLLTIHPTPLPLYSGVALGPRGSVADECGNVDAVRGADLFWISDASINLNNMYLLVRNRYRNWRHIIKVIAQEGTKCRFQLIAFGSTNYNGQFSAEVVQSVVPIPTFDSSSWGDRTDTDIPTINPWTVLSVSTMAALSPVLPNDDEITNLRQLETLTLTENAYGVVAGFPTPREVFTIVGEDIIEIEEVSPVPLPAWFDWPIYLEEYPETIRWGANVGDEIRESQYNFDIFVANIIPSTIKAVYAYRTINDRKVLMSVPSSYYNKNEAEELKDIDENVKLTITSLRVKVPLSHIQGENWEDQIYVTMDSSVGPNTVDVLENLITTYTDKSIDAISFADVRTKIDNYPSSFALLERLDIYQVLNDIAMLSRCVLYLSNDVFYIKYLSEEPTEDMELTADDISGQHDYNYSYGDASQLVTKLVSTWRPNYLPDKEEILTLRHNVQQYGLHEREVDFFIYNIEELVIKSATFWLIRWANLWRRVSFTAFLPQLQLDLYDTVGIEDIKSVIEEMSFDSNTNSITFNCWQPVRLGETTQYQFAWPSQIDEELGFPAELEIIQGNAGGSGIGKGIVTPIQGQTDG